MKSDRNIFIDKETLKAAEENTTKAIKKAHEAIATGTPDEIRAAINEVIQRSQAQRAFIKANYHL